MPLDFSPTKKQLALREAIDNLCRFAVRPQSLAWDQAKDIPHDFLANFMNMARASGSSDVASEFSEGDKKRDTTQPTETNRSSMMGAEALAWGDAALMLSMPGPGLGAPPVRASGTPEQKERFFSIFRDMSGGLQWGAYGLTEPGAGSDVAGIRTSCRKDGDHWVLNGRKCYITNGARASWVVIFATIDPGLGRAGHRAFVVEKGTPGFSVGRIEDKMGLRANETAELVLEDCRVPADNLLGGEDKYVSKEGFMTAMKTFDNTRPLVAAMALGIGRAAYEYARDFVKEHYVLSRPVPRYAAIAERLARVQRRLQAAWTLTFRACWLADHHLPNAREASMSKAAAGEAAIHACIEAIEICGAHGSIAEEHALLEKWFRDIKVYDIFEGTGQIQRIVISKRILEGLHAFLSAGPAGDAPHVVLPVDEAERHQPVAVVQQPAAVLRVPDAGGAPVEALVPARAVEAGYQVTAELAGCALRRLPAVLVQAALAHLAAPARHRRAAPADERAQLVDGGEPPVGASTLGQVVAVVLRVSESHQIVVGERALPDQTGGRIGIDRIRAGARRARRAGRARRARRAGGATTPRRDAGATGIFLAGDDRQRAQQRHETPSTTGDWRHDGSHLSRYTAQRALPPAGSSTW
jgi:acyl-CoA dehydrogenase